MMLFLSCSRRIARKLPSVFIYFVVKWICPVFGSCIIVRIFGLKSIPYLLVLSGIRNKWLKIRSHRIL